MGPFICRAGGELEIGLCVCEGSGEHKAAGKPTLRAAKSCPAPDSFTDGASLLPQGALEHSFIVSKVFAQEKMEEEKDKFNSKN